MKCLLKSCDNPIPKTRKKSATYCSDNCYKEAQRQRSSRRYASISEPAKELKRNESLLDFLYSVSLLGKSINADDLSMHKFDFGLSTGEHFDDKKRICKIIGKYAYHINPDKSLIIWKLKQPQ